MKAKENSIISTSVDVRARTLAFVISNGKDGDDKREIGTLLLDLTKVSASNLDYAAFHGFKQRVADKAALGQFDKAGNRVTPEMKLASMAQLVEFYNSGAEGWSPVRSGERVGSDELLLARALQQLNPLKPADDIRKAVAGWTKVERAALMLRTDVKPLIDAMQAEATGGIDTDELLSGF